MSKLKCICGNRIVDQSSDLSYKAHFIRDQDYDKSQDYSKDIQSFIDAIKTNTRDNWIEDYFGTNIYQNLPDGTVIEDIISRYKLNYEGSIYQCINCGRVKIQKGMTNFFESFLPESSNYENIFTGIQDKQS